MSEEFHHAYVGGDRPLADDPVRSLVVDEDVASGAEAKAARAEYDLAEQEARPDDVGRPPGEPFLDNANAGEDGVPRAVGPLPDQEAAPPARDESLGDPYADPEAGGNGAG